MDEPKQELVQRWLQKAAEDLGSAEKLAREPDPYINTALFHCQQAAEKAVKGFLVFHDQPFEKAHDIERLIDLAVPIHNGFAAFLDDAEMLNPYAVSLRYPDENLEPDRSDFNRAWEAANKMFNFVLSLMPATVHP